MSLQVISARLDLVSQFYCAETLREKITDLLRRTYDSQRLVQKFSMGRGDAEDLVSLLRTIEATNEVASVLKNHVSHLEANGISAKNQVISAETLAKLCRRLSLDGPSKLAFRINEAIDEEGLMQSHRIEESNTAEMVALAQGVLLEEGTVDDQDALSQIVRASSTPKALKGQENAEGDVWIMRRRSA